MVHGNWTKNTIFKLSLIGRCAGQAVVNNHYFEATGVKEALLISDTVAQAAGKTLADDWLSNLLATWRACHTNDYFLDRVEGQVVERPGNFEHRLVGSDGTSVALPLAGTVAAAADDLAASALIRWRTVLAGKHHRGRSYVGPLFDTAVAAGVLDASAVTIMTNYANAMITRYTGAGAGVTAGYNLTIYSRPYSAPDGAYTRRIGGVLTVVNNATNYDGDSTFVSAASIDANARVQRRREIGVGS